MSTINLPKVRACSDITFRVSLKDNDVAIDWTSLTNVKALIYSDVQKAVAGRCDIAVDEDDHTVLVCTYSATKPQYLGINSIVIRCKYQGREKTYDKPCVDIVARTAEATGQTQISDPEVDVDIDVEEVSTSLLDNAIAAAFDAAADAEEAANLVPLQVLQDCVTATGQAQEATTAANNAADAANAAGITQVEASVDANVGTPSVDVDLTNKKLTLGFHNMKGIQGETGATPDISIGEVTTGAAGSPAAATMTGTAAAPVLNLTIPKGDKGDQGNSGYQGAAGELQVVNNLTDGGAAKALSAEMGKTLEGEVSQLEAKVNEFTSADFVQYPGWMNSDSGNYNDSPYNSFSVIPVQQGCFYKITAKDTPCHLCFLASFDGVPTTAFDKVGSGRIVIGSVGGKVEGYVPFGANYIYVLRSYSFAQIQLPEIIINGVNIASPVMVQTGKLAYNDMLLGNELRDNILRFCGWMNSDGGNYDNNPANAFSVIPVCEGVGYEITAKETPCQLAFLNSFDGVPSSAFDINGQRFILSSVGAKVSGIVPTGAKYLYFLSVYRYTAISHPEVKVGEIDVLERITNQIYALAELTTWTKEIKYTPGYTEQLLASNANSYYINANPIYPAPFPSTSSTIKTTNPTWLRKGDAIKVISPAMGGNTAVVCKADGPDFLTANYQHIEITPTGSGYDTTYDFTVVDEGYYVISWSANYAQAKAYIIYGSHNAIDDNTNHIADLSNKVSKLDNIGPIVNVFGNVLPKNFKTKFFGMEDDVEIVCVGDSLTGLVENCDHYDEPEHLAPGLATSHWTSLLLRRLCYNPPVYDRLDSQRNGVNVFTKVGNWVDAPTTESGDYGNFSQSANTFKSASQPASASFALDLDEYEKATIVFSMSPDGCDTEIEVAEGNGKLLASLDKTTWAEANGFSVLQTTAEMQERHRRVWMKKVSGATGEVNITYKRKSTDISDSHYMYFWGIERWNGASLFLTNLGRGGRTTYLLGVNMADVLDRHPDLCIFEMPLANETVQGANTYASLLTNYTNYVNNFKTATNQFEDTELMVVLPHGRSAYYSGNRAVKYVTSGVAHTINHFMCKHLFDSVAGLLSDYPTHTCCLDLMEQLYNEGLIRDYTIQGWLATSSIDVPTMTYDGIHLNTYGSEFWAKYLAGVFQ